MAVTYIFINVCSFNSYFTHFVLVYLHKCTPLLCTYSNLKNHQINRAYTCQRNRSNLLDLLTAISIASVRPVNVL